jgi:hypothetical protein
MAKFKPTRGKKQPMPQQRANAIGCVILLVLLFVVMFVLMYYTVKQG